MGAGCGEQGAPGAGGGTDLFFDALRKHTVTRTMTAGDCLCEVVAIACRNVRPVEVDHVLSSLGVNQAARFSISFYNGNS